MSEKKNFKWTLVTYREKSGNIPMPEFISSTNFLSRITESNLFRKRPWIFEKFSDEFVPKKLLFYHEKEDDFYTSSWKWFGKKCFHAYRLLAAFVIFSYLLFDYTWEWFVYYKRVPLYYGIYATNWGFLSCVFSFVYLAILHVFRIKRWDISPHATRISWFMYITSANCVMVTCIVYWLALSDATEGIFSTLESRIKHSLPLTLVIVDVFLSAAPIRLVHVIYPGASGLLYTLFNVCYYLGGGLTPDGRSNAIYPMINWDEPLFAFIGSMYVFLVCFIMHLVMFLLYLLRVYLTNSDKKSRSNTLDDITFGKDGQSNISMNLIATKGGFENSNGKVKDLNHFQQSNGQVNDLNHDPEAQPLNCDVSSDIGMDYEHCNGSNTADHHTSNGNIS